MYLGDLEMRWRFSGIEFDPFTRRLYGAVNRGRLGKRDGKVLQFLLEKRFENDDSYENEDIINYTWPAKKGALDDLHHSITRLRQIFGGDSESFIVKTPYRLVPIPERINDGKQETSIASDPYRLVKRPEVLEEGNASRVPGIEPLNSAPPPASTVDPSSDSFTFLIDGMIIDTVVELLKHHESMVPIINRSRFTYQRGLEDFAFSIVYASSITCSTDIVVRSNDPVRFSRSEVLSQLGRLWIPHDLDQNLKKGKILENAEHREQVRKYVEAAGRCVMNFDWAFRDWFFGEASRHIGEDESLFEEGLPAERLKFKNHVLLNYRYPDLQAALGGEATSRAVMLLREATSNSKRPYTTSSLYEFATTNIVGLVTVMLEYDISAKDKKIWRMPHLLRSLVKQDVIFNSSLQQQIHLKSIITQHALAAALRQVEDIDRQSLLTVLMNMRGASPFKEIREILVEYKLLLSQLKAEGESKASFILMEIARLANSKNEVSDRFTLAQRAALRALDQTNSDQYAARLWRVFPALRPTMAPRPS
jgi:DNA-binding winged helix-turn-helix (wHTH) protein